MTIGFAGASHLGLVSSVAAASKGLDVLVYDPDAARCEALRQGRWPIFEPGLAELAESHRARLDWTADPDALAACPLVYCSADVPTGPDDRSDLSVIRELIETAAGRAGAGSVLVILSQVPPGLTRAIAQRAPRGMAVFYQVETLIVGQAVERARHPERIIVGCRDPNAGLPAPYQTYLEAFACPVLRMRYESAELAKISINLFLASSISVANTLAEACEAIGADYAEIVPALTSDRRIGPHGYVRPGLGLSGGNLERDLATLRALADEHGTDAGIVEAWLANSRSRRDWALKALHAEVLSRVREPVIAIWGLAYKPGTSSTKNSAAVALLDRLGSCAVRIYDPQAELNGSAAHVTQAASALEACRGADALVIMTPWPEFSAVRPVQVRELLRGRTIVDPYGVLAHEACAALGLRHAQLGLAPPREQQDDDP